MLKIPGMRYEMRNLPVWSKGLLAEQAGMKPFSLFLISCFLFLISPAQQMKVDSLRKALLIAKEDTNKVNALNDLARELTNNDPDTSITLSTQALELSEKLDWKKGIANSYIW